MSMDYKHQWKIYCLMIELGAKQAKSRMTKMRIKAKSLKLTKL